MTFDKVQDSYEEKKSSEWLDYIELGFDSID